ncbi:MAG: hypothetical protein J2P48_24575 [Alphaproteobacteria bacterium]|nr:hypothetical protein [Alphaproteobacteria bacterium]
MTIISAASPGALLLEQLEELDDPASSELLLKAHVPAGQPSVSSRLLSQCNPRCTRSASGAGDVAR